MKCKLGLIGLAVASMLGLAEKASAQQYQPATDVDLKAAYCLEMDKKVVAAMERDAASPPNDPEMIDILKGLDAAKDRWQHVRDYVLLRVSEGLDPNAVIMAAHRADTDIKRGNVGDDAEGMTRARACNDNSWLPF